MSKFAVGAKPAKAQRPTHSNVGAVERRNSLGSHLCVQRAAAGPAVHPNASSLVRDVANTSGQPLDAKTKEFMEPRFGHDFSGVRIHADEAAARATRAVNAHAYTTGSHLAFGAGQYNPTSPRGQRLIAHELTHVIQQASGPVSGTEVEEGLSVSHAADSFEQRAQVITEAVMNKSDRSPVTISRSLTAPRFQTTTGKTLIQRDTAGDINAGMSVASGIAGAAIGIAGLVAGFRSAVAGERQAEASEYPLQATGGFNFDSYSFGSFYHQGQRVPLPGISTQGGPEEGADELPPIPLIHVVAGDANEAVIELTLKTDGKDIFSGLVQQGDSRGYAGGPSGAGGNLVFTSTNQLPNAGDVAVVAIHFRGTNHPARQPVQRFHGRIVIGANGIIYRVECSHTSGMQGVVSDCNSQRRPPIIVGSGRLALHENPSSGELPSVRQRRREGQPAGEGPEPPNVPSRNRAIQ
jgi:hypothetical protein